MAFLVGQKVVCVNASECFDILEIGLRSVLKEKEIYEIEWVGTWNCGLCVRLRGVIRQHPTKPDWPFGAFRFRPIVEKSTDTGMAILCKILDRETVKDDKPIKVRQG